jgi:signal transduction histidine kinase
MLDLVSELETELGSIDDPARRVDLLNQLASELQYRETARAIELSAEARQLAADHDYQAGLIDSLHNLATFHILTSDYDSAFSLAFEALSLTPAEDRVKHAQIMRAVGNVHYHLANYPNALEVWLKALKISEGIGDKLNESALLNNIGLLCIHLDDLQTARKYLDKSIRNYRNLDERKGEADSLNNLCSVYHLLGNTKQAFKYGARSLELYREVGTRRGESQALFNLGNVFVATEDYRQAQGYFEQCLTIAREIGYRQQEVAALRMIGEAHTLQGDAQAALPYLKDALAAAEPLGIRGEVFKVYEGFAQAYEAMGDFEQALNHYKLFHTSREDIFNAQADARLKSLQVIHELETARRETEIFQLRNVELKEEIEAKEQLIAELDAFAGTVAHDLKNPLTALLGFGNILQHDLSEFDDPEPLSLLAEMLQMADKMQRIIHELLTLARVRRHEISLEPVDMGQVIWEAETRLHLMIDQSNAEIVKPEKWPESLGHAAWIEEVWTNYISNAIKYGGNPPRIELGATAQNGMIRFWVQDNGDGLNREEQAKLFTEFTRLDAIRAQGHGLGLSIVKRIIDKLGGEVGVESEGIPGKGSTFYFTLPSG